MTAQFANPASFPVESDALTPAKLRAIADIGEVRGDVSFTPGGGVIFDTPMTREEQLGLPVANPSRQTLHDLPQDGFFRYLQQNSEFRKFVDTFTVASSAPGYRLVVVPLTERLTPGQLRALANAAETFGHGALRMTANVSIRLPFVHVALLRPLFRALSSAGLIREQRRSIAA